MIKPVKNEEVLSPDEALTILKELLTKKKLVIFAGSGVSVDSGLPTWDGFIDFFIELCEGINEALPEYERFDTLLEDCKRLKTKDPIKTATVLKHQISKLEKEGVSMNYLFKERLVKLFSAGECNPIHENIVKTNYQYILTTNYDNFFEEAARKNKVSELLTRSYSYSEPNKIANAIYERKPAIIHLNGLIADISIDGLIITAQDYVNIKKKNPAYNTLLQSILIHYSVLLYGYGGSDPHLEELMEEMSYMFSEENKMSDLPKAYLVLRKEKVNEVIKTFKSLVRTKIIVVEDHNQGNKLIADLQELAPRT